MQNSSRNHLILASVFALLFVTPGKTLKKKKKCSMAIQNRELLSRLTALLSPSVVIKIEKLEPIKPKAAHGKH